MSASYTMKVQQWASFLAGVVVAITAAYSFMEALPVLPGMEEYSAAFICYGIMLLAASAQLVLEGRLCVRDKDIALDQGPWMARIATFVVLICLVVVSLLLDPKLGLMPSVVVPALFYTTAGVAATFLLLVLLLSILMLPSFADYTVEATGDKCKRRFIEDDSDIHDDDLLVETPRVRSQGK